MAHNKDETTSTHSELWVGIDLKIGSATFHFLRMGDVLQPPKLDAHMVAIQSSGAIVGGNWHEAFYAHLDAFLSIARSVPELIRCCFGVDDGPPREMKNWFKDLDLAEQNRRLKFQNKFKTNYDAFCALALGRARHISEHRTGVPPVIVTVTGRFGVTYTGGPTSPIPISEAKEMPPGFGWKERHDPLRPSWENFDIDGKPLFQTCREYLESAQALVARARALAQEVHGDLKLTPPPSNM